MLYNIKGVFHIYTYFIFVYLCLKRRLFPFFPLIHSPLSPNYFAQDESFHTDVPVPRLPPRAGLSRIDSASNYATSEISAAHAENELKSMNERYVLKYSDLKHINKTFTSKQPTLGMSAWGVGRREGSVVE